MEGKEQELGMEEVNVYAVNCGQLHGCMVDCPDITAWITSFF